MKLKRNCIFFNAQIEGSALYKDLDEPIIKEGEPIPKGPIVSKQPMLDGSYFDG